MKNIKIFSIIKPLILRSHRMYEMRHWLVNKSFWVIASLIFLIFAFQTNQIVSGQSKIITHDLAIKSRVSKIDILRLPLSGNTSGKYGRWHLLNDSYHSNDVGKFFETKGNIRRCLDNQVKKPFVCSEIKNVEIGYFYNQANRTNQYPELFIALFHQRNWKAEVFHDSLKNEFFLRVRHYRFYGPFRGNPLEELKNARIPEKQKNILKGVSLKYLSSRWEFPKEEDAMVNRGAGYNYIGAMPSGREIEQMRLQSQFFRFRLENNSGQKLFLLYAQENPKFFWENFFLKRKNPWRNSMSRIGAPDFNLYGSPHWVILPKKSALEFEVKFTCFKPLTKCQLGLYLNDNPSFWNTVEIKVPIQARNRRKFSKKNAPPKWGSLNPPH